jgi:hypothetical protein
MCCAMQNEVDLVQIPESLPEVAFRFVHRQTLETWVVFGTTEFNRHAQMSRIRHSLTLLTHEFGYHLLQINEYINL